MTNPEPVCRLSADSAERRRMAAYRLVRNLCGGILTDGHEPTPALMLGAACVQPMTSDGDLENIPMSGPVLVAVGALYRTLDALAASALLDECRPDVKVLADPFVAAAPNLTPRFLAYDPWDEGQAAPANVRASRRALGWLRSGRLLAAFVDDARWSVVVRLARLARCAIVPAAVARTLRETGTIELRFGAPLAPARLAGFATDGEAVGYLRWRVNVLSWRHEAALRLVPRIATAESAAGGQS